jgi:hypothetical protein
MKKIKSKIKLERIVILIYFLIFDIEYLYILPLFNKNDIFILFILYLTTLFEIFFIV